MKLKELLYGINVIAIHGSNDVQVEALQIDSRKVKKGSCFMAITGSASDGHEFIDISISNGAVAIICQHLPGVLHPSVTYVQVHDTALTAGLISHAFYGHPSRLFKLVGVTGTNGKTTIATLLYKLFTSLGFTCGLVSTVENIIAGQVLPSTHTTPNPIDLNFLLKQMADSGCRYVFMECSSHAIHQQRIAGLTFAGAIFSNITHDHLDYHKTFDEYIRVKKSWFDTLPSNAFAISNLDDKRGMVMLQNTAAKKYYYSLRTLADFRGKILENALSGLHLQVDEQEVYCRLIGEFNAYNFLAVYAAGICLQVEKQLLLQTLSNLTGAAGRFEYITGKKSSLIGIVDYAHTPDALLNVLVTIKKLRKGNERILTVVGCGGDRDKTKRPIMAEVACEYSDRVIFTSDNPRTEDPAQILAQMEAGVNAAARKKYITISDRKEAIKTAVSMASADDIILLAGKGHENYQEINGHKYDFDDRQQLIEMFELFEK